ncbi:MAG: transcriptional regulator [Legionellales bacterium]|nr:transcriptional regulator [Legionellales bacterium]
MIKPIRDEQSYTQALARIEALWGAKDYTDEGDELDILLTLVEAYEQKHYPMPPSDPVNSILFTMDRLHLSRKDLEPFMGTKSRVSEILNRKRPLTLSQIVRLHHGLNIPYESLIDESVVLNAA